MQIIVPTLSKAIEDNLLSLYRQAIQPIDTPLGAPPEYYEILLRIDDRGVLRSPVAFLVSLTSNELCQLDCWVFQQVCLLPSQFRYSVNLSTHSLENAVFVEQICAITTHWLIIELTEHSNYSANTIGAMRRLQSRFPVLMDDMCSGYSGLLSLHDLPFDGIKIDGQIISAICTNKKSRMMTGGIMAIAWDLNWVCVAEFVETIAAWDLLKRIRDEYAPGLKLHIQGFAAGLPEPALPALEEFNRLAAISAIEDCF